MSFYLREAAHSPARPRPGTDWEECSCLLCGSSRWQPFVEATDYAQAGTGLWFMVVRCPDCGLCFTNPRPSERGIGTFYHTDYAPHRSVEGRNAGPRWWHRLPIVSNRPDMLRKTLPLYGQGRLLDFGCGSGSFLLRMRQQGWKVTGLDVSQAVVERLRSDLGLHALTGTLPHPALANASFDIITMWQALEHVHQPLDILGAARQLLAPGGKLIVAVPNIDSLAFRLFGSAWNGLDLPRHLIHFSPNTLRLMLQRTGFRPGRVAMLRRSGWLRDSARLAVLRVPHEQRWFHWLRGRAMATLTSWYGYWTRQADCMMVVATRR